MKRLKTYELFGIGKKTPKIFQEEIERQKIKAEVEKAKKEREAKIEETTKQSVLLNNEMNRFLKEVGVEYYKKIDPRSGQSIWKYFDEWIISITWWNGHGIRPVEHIDIDVTLQKNRRKDAGEDLVERDFPLLKNYLRHVIKKYAYDKKYSLKIYPSNVYDIVKELDVEKFELYKATKSYNL